MLLRCLTTTARWRAVVTLATVVRAVSTVLMFDSISFCVLAAREKLHAVQILFLNEPNRHHAILLEPAIELAAIDSQCGCGTHLVATKLLQYRQNVTLLNFGERHRVVHVCLEHLPEVVHAPLRM